MGAAQPERRRGLPKEVVLEGVPTLQKEVVAQRPRPQKVKLEPRKEVKRWC